MTLTVGVDLGTSGCRAIAINRENRSIVAQASVSLPPSRRTAAGASEQDPADWWRGVERVLQDLTGTLDGREIDAIAVDGTSSTLLLTDIEGTPLTPALMYDDTRARDQVPRIAEVAPGGSPVHSAGSSLAKLLHLIHHSAPPPHFRVLHQADWISGRLLGRYGLGDENNALKLGYDPVHRCWPEWMGRFGFDMGRLPEVIPAGTPLGRIAPAVAKSTGLPPETRVIAGTTDSTAAFLATGARQCGEAVTSLGSTLVLKILSNAPLFDPARGVYSHRVGDRWLVGGASNSGGAVLAHYFSRGEMTALSQRLDPARPTGLDYYPLLNPGERFPINDPHYPPRVAPRPHDDRIFFQGLLEGIAAIEQQGYALLHNLGAPAPRQVITTGGGAANDAWRRIRQRLLGVPVTTADCHDAAYGAALLALT